MTEIRNYDTPELVAEAAAENAVEILAAAITTKGHASWVLAGGTTPLLAYRELVKTYSNAVDWSKVTVLMGDERMVPYTGKDSNWGTVMSIFAESDAMSQLQRIAPDISSDTELAAVSYERAIKLAHIKEFDLVWLGVGEDGHTLSLFPNNVGFTTKTDSYVIAVHDSPKLPLARITLSLKALEYVHELVIFAVGSAKKQALRDARLGGKLPIAVAALTAETHGAEVRWLYDDAAWED